MKLKPILFLCALVVLGLARSTTPAATKPTECEECRVIGWWWNSEAGLGSGILPVGGPFLTNEDRSETTIKNYTFPDEKTFVTVSVEHEELKDKKYHLVRLGISTGNTAQEYPSRNPSWVYAEGVFRKDSPALKVQKTIQFENLWYTVQLICHKPSNKK